jgi:rhomboid family GlyGly-CTERM serine protease
MEVRKHQRATPRMSSVLERCHLCLGRLPVFTLLLSAIAIVLQFHPDLGNRMSLDRTAIAVGEYWRFLTGHLTHWNADHLSWDLFMFALLGAMIERRSRPLLLTTLLLSATSISMVTWISQPTVEHYRGLSGIDSALFTLGVLILFDDARRAKQPIAEWVLIAMAMGFVGKIVWELATGSTLFVDSSAAGFTPLPLAHATGGVAGMLAWFGARMWNTHRSCGNGGQAPVGTSVSGGGFQCVNRE